MMKLAKYLGGLALAAVLLFAFAITFSSVESRFECNGTLSSKNASSPATIYIKFAQYRWWVGLWSASDGALWVEVPKRTTDYFGNITKVADQFQISRSPEELKGLWGYFSTLSGALVLETSAGNFDGRCRKLDA